MDVKILKYKDNKDGSATLELEFDFAKGERRILAANTGRKRLTKKALEDLVQYAIRNRLHLEATPKKKLRRRIK